MSLGIRPRTPELRVYITRPERTERTWPTQYLDTQGQHGSLVGELYTESPGEGLDQRENSEREG